MRGQGEVADDRNDATTEGRRSPMGLAGHRMASVVPAWVVLSCADLWTNDTPSTKELVLVHPPAAWGW